MEEVMIQHHILLNELRERRIRRNRRNDEIPVGNGDDEEEEEEAGVPVQNNAVVFFWTLMNLIMAIMMTLLPLWTSMEVIMVTMTTLLPKHAIMLKLLILFFNSLYQCWEFMFMQQITGEVHIMLVAFVLHILYQLYWQMQQMTNDAVAGNVILISCFIFLPLTGPALVGVLPLLACCCGKIIMRWMRPIATEGVLIARSAITIIFFYALIAWFFFDNNNVTLMNDLLPSLRPEIFGDDDGVELYSIPSANVEKYLSSNVMAFVENSGSIGICYLSSYVMTFYVRLNTFSCLYSAAEFNIESCGYIIAAPDKRAIKRLVDDSALGLNITFVYTCTFAPLLAFLYIIIVMTLHWVPLMRGYQQYVEEVNELNNADDDDDDEDEDDDDEDDKDKDKDKDKDDKDKDEDKDTNKNEDKDKNKDEDKDEDDASYHPNFGFPDFGWVSHKMKGEVI